MSNWRNWHNCPRCKQGHLEYTGYTTNGDIVSVYFECSNCKRTTIKEIDLEKCY